MEWLEGTVGREVASAASVLAETPSRPPQALAQIETSLARVGQRFEWGDISADEYQEKRERLLALRAEIIGAPGGAAPLSAVPSGLVTAWDAGDQAVRRALVANVFAELDLLDGRIAQGRPRADVAAEVARHLDAWPGVGGAKLRLRFA
jgi:hypothetical protein